MSEYTIDYWKRGTEIVEYQLNKLQSATHLDMPFGSDPAFFHLWKQTKMEAYRHALDMLGNYE